MLHLTEWEAHQPIYKLDYKLQGALQEEDETFQSSKCVIFAIFFEVRR